MPEVYPGAGVEKHDLGGVPAEADGVFHGHIHASGNGGAEQMLADAQGDDLLDPVVFDVVDLALHGGAGFNRHVLGPDAEGVGPLACPGAWLLPAPPSPLACQRPLILS